LRQHGITIFDNATIRAWNTVSDALAPPTDAYRGYLIAIGGTWGNITNSDLSYLGSDIFRQEGLNFVDNTHTYLIYNTTFSHNGRGMIMEECENYNISHCNIHDPAEAGIGVYYSNNIVVENCMVSAPVHPGIYLYEANNNIIRYNTIQDCVDSGMRIRSNSNNNTLIGNDITGSGVYDYYFSSSSINNTIRDSASTTDKIRCTCSSVVNIENTDNVVFTEDSVNITRAYPTNFSMYVSAVAQTFNITQNDMTITPSSDCVNIWNFVWGNVVTFNASNVSGAPLIWFNATNWAWSNSNVSIYRDDVMYANEAADVAGHIAYNYSGGWSGHWFEFNPVNVAPEKPTVELPANGATGTSTNPTLRVQATDDNVADTLNVTFYAQGGTQIGTTQTGVANGGTTSVVWSGRSYSTTYYWYAVSDDGTAQTQSDTWHFTTQTDGGDGGGGGGSSHVILISGCTDWEGNAGSQVYIDFGCTGETAGATFTTNATNGSIDPSSGIYTWNTNTADGGVYTWRFNVENVYTISDYCDVTITVYHYASPTNLAATTGNFWVNHTWGGNGYVDSYNVSVNDVWGNGSTDQHSYHVRSPHAWSNISVAAYNDTTEPRRPRW
jgi:parallel beta-helix repeat protein